MANRNKFMYISQGLVGAASIAVALVTPFLRGRRTRWGATDDEVGRSLPGDHLVPSPRWQWTHAITIQAPAAAVWPWLVQIGQGRGGFYSYELLENLVGCDMRNANRIIPEFQHLEVGDTVRLHPRIAMPVAVLEPGQALALCSRIDLRTGTNLEASDTLPDEFINLAWTWYLDQIDERTTRLITRWQADYSPGMKNRLGFGPLFVEPIGFVMDRKMLKGIKQRVEATVN